MYISCEKLYLILLRQLEPVGKKKNRRNVSVKVLERGWLCAVVPVPVRALFQFQFWLFQNQASVVQVFQFQ